MSKVFILSATAWFVDTGVEPYKHTLLWKKTSRRSRVHLLNIHRKIKKPLIVKELDHISTAEEEIVSIYED